MAKFLVSPQFAKHFAKVTQHYECSAEEIAKLKEDIRTGVFPLEHYEKSFEHMAELVKWEF